VDRLWFLGYPPIGRLSTVLQRVYLRRRSVCYPVLEAHGLFMSSRSRAEVPVGNPRNEARGTGPNRSKGERRQATSSLSL
jgi:hypothetical protein